MEKTLTKKDGGELCEKAVALRVEQAIAYVAGDVAKAEALNNEVLEIVKKVGLAFNKNVVFKVIVEADKVLGGKPRGTIAWL